MIPQPRIAFKPFDYQEKMIPWLEEKPRSALFASPGLGKSVCTLKAYDNLITDGASKGLLIVAPLRVCTITWPNEVAKWGFAKWMTIANMRTEEGVKHWINGTADIYVINFEQLASKDMTRTCRFCKNERPARQKCLKCRGKGFITTHYKGFIETYFKGKRKQDLPVDSVMIDELSLAKNPSSKRINALRAYREMFDRFNGLTGTPVPNTYLDLWAQIRFLDAGERLGKVYSHFRNRYFYALDPMGYKWEIKNGAKEEIQQKISDICLVMLGEDYLDIPQTLAIDEPAVLNKNARKQYEELKKELLLQLANGEIEALNAAVLTMKLLQITGGTVYDAEKNVHEIHSSKLEALKKIRKRHPKEPLLVLTAFKHESRRILKAFPEARMFDEKDLGKWQAGKIPMWVADPRSLSHGIDGLQKGGRIAVWFTLTYSSETYLQTNARLIRTGQSFETIVYRIMISGTVDDAVAEALKEKGDTQTGLVQALKNLQTLEQTKLIK